jgi:hypothetical protein
MPIDTRQLLHLGKAEHACDGDGSHKLCCKQSQQQCPGHNSADSDSFRDTTAKHAACGFVGLRLPGNMLRLLLLACARGPLSACVQHVAAGPSSKGNCDQCGLSRESAQRLSLTMFAAHAPLCCRSALVLSRGPRVV